MDNSKRIEQIKQRLTDGLNAENVDVVDESHLHAGHAGAKTGMGHFNVTVIADAFAGKSLIERHRQVYTALGDMMQTDIHALGIKAYTPEEL
ncbi:BolA family protein [Sulfuriflexus sp.]|uniref:BolA family protein n=1 Tax=Sulfuriflexus sp. TaxID=2015443 RepID=UPI0028CD8BC1|nr:BolA family protein [Sulfuriflexus sp.]MDT8403736.1 BolA family protein [Sulfuriflexus sp.]